MRFFTARRLALAALVPALLVFSVIPGCSNQGEGERCGSKFGGPDDADCGDGLVCVAFADLDVNRCCYPGQMVVHDSRCLPTTGNTGGSGGSTAGGSGGSAAGGTGGSTAGGTGGGDDAGADDAATAGASDVGGGSN